MAHDGATGRPAGATRGESTSGASARHGSGHARPRPTSGLEREVRKAAGQPDARRADAAAGNRGDARPVRGAGRGSALVRSNTHVPSGAKAWLDELHSRSHSWTPKTYAFNRGLLAEPGDDERRGRILRAFGDRRVDRISADDVCMYLRSLDGGAMEGQRAPTGARECVRRCRGARLARGNPATGGGKAPPARRPSLEVFSASRWRRSPALPAASSEC